MNENVDGAASRASVIRISESTRSVVLEGCRRVLDEVFEARTTDTRGPFGRLIQPHQQAFVLVNHVTHRRPDESQEEFSAKITSSEVIHAVCDLLGLALDSSANITIGNAPIQSCDYQKLMEDSGLTKILEEWEATTRPQVRDLRGYASSWNRLRAKVSEERRDPQDAIAVDLGSASLLEPLYAGGREPQFRVMDYSSDEISEYHSKGRHVYVVNRRLLESSLIVSVPKLKTHQKVGITCAIKGTVGAIFLKQCLAHHRHGGPAAGGDEYSRDAGWRQVISEFRVRSDGLGTGRMANFERVLSRVAYKAAKLPKRSFMEGAWSGNDTAWRMSLDIARILRFARADGSLASTPQREHVALIDGLVAGEGEGPMRPTPREEGLLIAGSDPLAADLMACLAMGWNPYSLPLLTGAVNQAVYPVSDARSLAEVRLTSDGDSFTVDEAPVITSRPFAPPKGWNLQDLRQRRRT